ncbi:hypothetical protein KDW_48930 [Dictyobacter vulcani]|uniref:Uncharacterized protein n=1 Tax=Dictyobacter vulcani TaxID=2607529 RepID=A0A5J4KW74_9CHLR|nr:hypothetical protein KDW_48930 [Dictyobacter vulcani]
MLGLLLCFSSILAIAPLRTLFNLQALDPGTYLLIGGATLVWAILMYSILHFHLFERFFRL